MGQRARGRTRDSIRKPRSAPFRDHDTMCPGSQRCADYGAQVVRILYSIQQDDKSLFAPARIRFRQNVFKRGPAARRRQRNNTLVVARIR